MGFAVEPSPSSTSALPPQCKDGSCFIFILNKEELGLAHDYADELFADEFIWSLAPTVFRSKKVHRIKNLG
jgi:hypothetical protein